MTVLLGLLLLAGCGDGPGGQTLEHYPVELPDGRVVECIVSAGGGVDCEWS